MHDRVKPADWNERLQTKYVDELTASLNRVRADLELVAVNHRHRALLDYIDELTAALDRARRAVEALD